MYFKNDRGLKWLDIEWLTPHLHDFLYFFFKYILLHNYKIPPFYCEDYLIFMFN